MPIQPAYHFAPVSGGKMPSRLNCPVTRAAGLGPLPSMLEERAGFRTLERVFKAEGVPLAVINARETFMPVSSMVGLFERAAQATQDRAFGLSVGMNFRHGEYGLWVEYATAGETLADALARAASTISFHQPGGRLVLEMGGATAVWRYVPPLTNGLCVQHSDHVIGPMISFCRSYLGPRWLPDWVEVNYSRDTLADSLERELNCPFRFECPGIGIAFAAEHLDVRRGDPEGRCPERQVTLLDVQADAALLRDGEPCRSVLSVVLLRLLDGRADIEGTAEALGLSVRSLQRRLSQQGVSYRSVVDSARLTRAIALLRDTSLSVTAIAFELGYADPPNFTRAFNRWAGCSPGEYRAMLNGQRRAPMLNVPV